MKYIILLELLFSFKLKAQQNVGARIGAMAETGVVLADAWSINSNQAGMRAVLKPLASLAYQRNVFSTEIVTQSAAFQFPLHAYTIGLVVSNYGFEVYNVQQIGMAVAKSFGPNLSAAMRFNYHQVHIPAYGKSTAFTADVGFLYQFSKRIGLGAHVQNVSNSSFANMAIYSPIPLLIDFGLSYKSTDQLLLVATLQQSLNRTPQPKLGIEYQVIPVLALRGGLSFNQLKQFAGLGLEINKMRIDWSVSSQNTLGTGSQISFQYEF
ncbi:MAG: hypothetical protein ACKOWL_02190 [Sphingobacteriaceae bacterium]